MVLLPAARQLRVHGRHFARRYGVGKEKALPEFAAQPLEALQLRPGFDFFGEHGHIEIVAERDNRFEQRVIANAFARPPVLGRRDAGS